MPTWSAQSHGSKMSCRAPTLFATWRSSNTGGGGNSNVSMVAHSCIGEHSRTSTKSLFVLLKASTANTGFKRLSLRNRSVSRAGFSQAGCGSACCGSDRSVGSCYGSMIDSTVRFSVASICLVFCFNSITTPSPSSLTGNSASWQVSLPEN